MNPREISNYTDGENIYPVTVVIDDINGMAIGKVNIDNKDRHVVRWNGDGSDIGFPQSHSKPVWMLLAKGIKLTINI